MSFQYRLATAQDVNVIVEFQLAMAFETEGYRLDRALCTQGVQAVFDVPARGTYYVAENFSGNGGSDSQITGSTLVVPEWSDWRNGEVWWIHSVFVRPEFRGRGVFSGLYRFISKQVEGRPDLRGLRLYVEKKNVSAQAVYRKLGMTDERYLLFEWMKKF